MSLGTTCPTAGSSQTLAVPVPSARGESCSHVSRTADFTSALRRVKNLHINEK